MRAVHLATLAVAALAAVSSPAHAHGMRSAYVEITQRDAERATIAIRGKVPVLGIEVTTAAPCELAVTETGRWLRCPGGLAGAALTVTGMGPIVSEAVIYMTFEGGRSTSACVTAGRPTWVVPGGEGEGALTIAARYLALGIEHIATGADHLLFLLALALCVRRVRALMLAETAFTLSHTLSFSASSLGWVHVSSAAAEACIAVSLVLVALDIGRPSADSPWKTAGLPFVFGLVHGLGFAGGLRELGLPTTEVPVALAGFATGVELGQIAFLALVVGVLWLVERAPRVASVVARGGAYGIGGIGWWWLLERIKALV